MVQPKKAAPHGDGWIDVSIPLRSGMVVWPGDPPVSIKRISDVARGDTHTLSEMCMGSHTGTHIDAPVHVVPGGASIDKMPADTVVGRARVIELNDPEIIRPEELVPHRIRRGERLLFKTKNSGRVWKSDIFLEEYVYISKEAADFLAARHPRVVGVDYLSVGGYHRDGLYPHQALFNAGVWLIEGLDLSRVSAGIYDMVCLPLRIENGDGSPARAFLRRVR